MRSLTLDEALKVGDMREMELWRLATDLSGLGHDTPPVTPDDLRGMALDIVTDAYRQTIRAQRGELGQIVPADGLSHDD